MPTFAQHPDCFVPVIAPAIEPQIAATINTNNISNIYVLPFCLFFNALGGLDTPGVKLGL